MGSKLTLIIPRKLPSYTKIFGPTGPTALKSGLTALIKKMFQYEDFFIIVGGLYNSNDITNNRRY